MTLYSHQQSLLTLNPPRYGLWHETGTGKSLTLIELIKKNNAAALLICPKSIKERWQRDTAHLQVTVVTKEEFRRDHKTIPHHQALVIDECFPAGTPVLTPNGYVPIEKISEGDMVINAFGIYPVTKTTKKKTSELVRIKLSNGNTIEVTPEHRLFTKIGWVMARELKGSVLLHYFTIHNIIVSSGEDVLLQELRSELQVENKKVSSLWCSYWDRISRNFPQFSYSGCFFENIRVEDVSSIKRKNIKVYNLSVAGHPSYVVKDILVHNCHAFSNSKSQLHKSALWWLKKHNPPFVWLATATPHRSVPWNCYALAALLGFTWNWRKFRDTFFHERYLGRRVIWEPNDDEQSKAKLSALYAGLGNFVKLDDCVDMPPAVWEYETLPLTSAQRKAITSLEEANPVVRYGKIHQIENGTLKGNEYAPNQIFPSSKVSRIVELAEEAPKIAIFARYNLQVAQIASALVKAHHRVYTLTGATLDADQVVRQAEADDNCAIVINTDKAEGYELPSFRNVVYASLPWSLVSFTQSQGRFRRINVPARVCYTVLTSDGEIDKAVKEALDNKMDFQIKLYEKEKETI